MAKNAIAYYEINSNEKISSNMDIAQSFVGSGPLLKDLLHRNAGASQAQPKEKCQSNHQSDFFSEFPSYHEAGWQMVVRRISEGTIHQKMNWFTTRGSTVDAYFSWNMALSLEIAIKGHNFWMNGMESSHLLPALRKHRRRSAIGPEKTTGVWGLWPIAIWLGRMNIVWNQKPGTSNTIHIYIYIICQLRLEISQLGFSHK